MWFSNLKIVLPDRVIEHGSLCVEDGRIVRVTESTAPGEAIDGTGLTAIPGLVDLHGDMLEWELHPRPGVDMPDDLSLCEVDKRLVSSGITTAYAAISFAWHADDSNRSEARARQLIALINKWRPKLLADHYVHARFAITNPDAGNVLLDLLDQDAVHFISLMDHTPGQGQYRDIEKFVKFMIKWRTEKEGVAVTEEDIWQYIRESQERPKGWDAVERVCNVAKAHGVHLASHDDDTVEKVDFIANFGVTVSEFPVSMEAAEAARKHGMHVVMGSPNALRGESHSGNLSATDAIAAGVVDTLATDYYPPAMVQAAYALVQRGILPLHEAVNLIATNPADAAGLHDRGTIEEGKQADVAFIEEAERPRVRGTLRAGVPVYWDARMAAVAMPAASPKWEPARGSVG